MSPGDYVGKLLGNLLRTWRSGSADQEPATLDSLTNEIAKLRGEIANLQLQWAEVLDKIAAWGNRVAARERKRVKATLDELGDEPAAEDAPEAPSAPTPMNQVRGNKADLYARMRARRGF